KFTSTPPNPDSDVVITRFLADLRASAARRKRELIEHYTRMNLGLSYEEFLNTAKQRFTDDDYRSRWSEIDEINLGAEVVICGFSGEPVIVRLDAYGETHWETNYSAVGTGQDIAFSFLCQREWCNDRGSPPQLMECLYRIYEAK